MKVRALACAVQLAAVIVVLASTGTAWARPVTEGEDDETVTAWSTAVNEAPLALVQGVDPTNHIEAFPGIVMVPGNPDSPFAGMSVNQAGWLTESPIYGQAPHYEIDLNRPDGTSGQWLAVQSPLDYDRHVSGDDGLASCALKAGLCGTSDGVVFAERFLIAAGPSRTISVVHWGNYLGGFEYWAAYWYDADADTSYGFLVSGPASGMPPLNLNPSAHASAARSLAQAATEFVPWSP